MGMHLQLYSLLNLSLQTSRERDGSIELSVTDFRLTFFLNLKINLNASQARFLNIQI